MVTFLISYHICCTVSQLLPVRQPLCRVHHCPPSSYCHPTPPPFPPHTQPPHTQPPPHPPSRVEPSQCRHPALCVCVCVCVSVSKMYIIIANRPLLYYIKRTKTYHVVRSVSVRVSGKLDRKDGSNGSTMSPPVLAHHVCYTVHTDHAHHHHPHY